MTGYGRALYSAHGREFTAEIRSVNNRYLDVTVKLPRAFAFAEDSVKARIKQEISRGKVDVYIGYTAIEEADVTISLNKPLVEGYLSAMRELVERYGVKDDISATALARLPDVLVSQKQEQDEAQLEADILAAVDEAARKYGAMRTQEGAALEADLRGRSQTILSLVEKVEQRSPVTLAEYRARLTQKMKETLESTAIDEGRILQEAAIYADKIAVEEETVRLRSHLSQLDAMLTNGGAIGRKLDFLLQEMNREANTIGSKGNDIEQARTVVEIKAELEKIREQTQNIE